MKVRYELTPQMRDYDELKKPGERRYVPYLMYFHRADFTSRAINTDRYGFRISTGPDGMPASVGGHVPSGPMRIVTGGSATLGVGASNDSNTLASALWTRHAPSTPWLNFGGYCFNPTQEVLLLALYRHLLGDIEEVVILSGINAVVVARLPEWQQGDHGAFFFCGEYFEKMEELRERGRDGKPKFFGRRSTPPTISTQSDLRRDADVVIDCTVESTVRQLDLWRRIAGPDTRISYVLQPMPLWMGRSPSPQEEALFSEYDQASELGPWEQAYADIASMEFGSALAAALRSGCEKQDVRFFDLNPILAEATTSQDWLFVDRVHYTDDGHDIIARTLAETLELS